MRHVLSSLFRSSADKIKANSKSPDVGLKHLHCGILVKAHGVNNQLDSAMKLRHVPKHL